MDKIEYEIFLTIRDYILKSSGIFLEYDKEYLIRQRITPILKLLDVNDFFELAEKIKTGLNYGQKDELIANITTNETSFFRDIHIFESFNLNILPLIFEKIKKNNSLINILSAGSSTGQEIYSISILINEYIEKNKIDPKFKSNFKIVGADINKKVIETAKNGVYSENEINKGLSKERIDKFFTKTDDKYIANNSIKNICNFKQVSMHEELSFNVLGKNFDIVFARNFLIYLSSDIKKKTIQIIHNLLNSDGFLVIGASENLLGYNNLFSSVNFNNTTFYKKMISNVII